MTNDNKITVQNLLGQYSINSMKNNWWSEVNVIIWGASNVLIKEDKEIQELITQMINNKITVEACLFCSEKLETKDLLLSLGVNVRYMGNPMTKYLQSNEKFITI